MKRTFISEKAIDQQERKLSKVIEKRDINPLTPHWELEPEAQVKHRRRQRDIPRASWSDVYSVLSVQAIELSSSPSIPLWVKRDIEWWSAEKLNGPL